MINNAAYVAYNNVVEAGIWRCAACMLAGVDWGVRTLVVFGKSTCRTPNGIVMMLAGNHMGNCPKLVTDGEQAETSTTCSTTAV